MTGLTLGTTYYFRATSVDGGGNSVTSPATTGSPASFVENAFSVWAPSTTPAVIDSTDTGAIEVGMRFRADVTGTVTGVRFYKATTNTGTHVGNLWSNTGTLLGTVTFTNESATGWQQANFSSPIAINANTTYVISCYMPAGHYSGNAAFFGTGVDNAPLHALANGVDGANGVYRYNASSIFPNQTFNNVNYWVDLTFATGGPSITAVSAAATPPTATITWTTDTSSNSRVDYGTTSSNLNLNAINASMVTAHSVGLTGLTTGTTYYYRVTSVDAFGNSTTSPVLANSPASFVESDTTAPVITAVSAAPGSNTAVITWTTNENSTSRVDYGTTSNNLNLNSVNNTQVTAHSISLSGLTTGITYYFRVTSVDGSSNSATSPASPAAPATFVTVAAGPPVITAVTAYPGGGGTALITWTTDKLSNSRVDYGTTSSNLNLNTPNATLVTAHSITLTGLTQGTTYYYRVTSVDGRRQQRHVAGLARLPGQLHREAGSALEFLYHAPGYRFERPGAVELGMRFRSDVAGVVTGVRFYKSAANTGPISDNLWSSTGTLLGTVTFSGETASGWQQANFASPIADQRQHHLRDFVLHADGPLLLRRPGLCQRGQQCAAARPGRRHRRGERRVPLRLFERVPEPDLAIGELLGGRGLHRQHRADHLGA